MRVLVVLLSANFYGTERHAVELANGLAAAGHEVALLLRRRPHDPGRAAGYAALRAAVAPGLQVLHAARAFPLPGLLLAAWRFRPDIIHTHYERSARWATRLPLGAPVVATNHAGWRADYARCDGLTCLTAAQRAQVPPTYRGHVASIGNWVLPHPSQNRQTARATARAALGEASRGFLIGCVARYDPEKGQAGLIAAFLAADLTDARLVLIGSGGEQGALHAQAEASGGRVRVEGFRADVRDLYPAFDLFVLNSTVEQLPLALLEALEAGVPAVATATDGAREIAAHLPLRLVPIGDAAALVAALRDGHAGRIAPSPQGAGPYRWEAVLPRLLEAYGAVIARRTGAAGSAGAARSAAS